jgi:hypothetical protein
VDLSSCSLWFIWSPYSFLSAFVSSRLLRSVLVWLGLTRGAGTSESHMRGHGKGRVSAALTDVRYACDGQKTVPPPALQT